MKAKLIARALPDRPDWGIIKDDIPLGKIYTVHVCPCGCNAFKFIRDLYNAETGEKRKVEVYMVSETDEPIGAMPCGLLEILN